ncbi:MAG: hypothetical protein KDI12_09615, partial [Anaerolineae bacterium]|nr:hypothetical protein [Anaerolineae bacterium]
MRAIHLIQLAAAFALIIAALLASSLANAGSVAHEAGAPASQPQPASTPEAAGSQPDSNCPAWQPPPSTSYQSFPNAGIYTFFDWPHLDPDLYPWLTGGHMAFTWRSIEGRGPGQYYWEDVDQWLASEAALGKTVALSFTAYEGNCCGGNQVPQWFNNAQGEWPAGNGYVTCSWTDYSGSHTEDIPMYWTAAFQSAYESFMQAIAARYGNDPRVALIEIAAGIYGETMPAESDDEVDACLQAAGLTSDLWTQTVNRITDIHQRAWQDTPMVLQYAPWYLYRKERRDITDYAASLGIGLKHNRLVTDHDDQVVRSDTATIHPDVCRTGQYDPMLQYAGQVPVGWEGESSYHPEASDLIWSLLNGLNKHPSYLLLGKATIATDDPYRQWALRLADRYTDVTVANTPGVWVALRDPLPPNPGDPPRWYPQWGNFDFWLRQDDNAPGGRSVPVWYVGPHPWGRYARRTDAASDNPDMYFDVDDAFIDGSGAVPVTVSVLYYDNGTDTWELQYDATGDNFKSAGVVQKTNSREWLETTFVLPDAQFASQLDGYDFRLRSRGDGNEYFSFVEVLRTGNEEEEGKGRKAGKENADDANTTVPAVSHSPNLPVTLSPPPSNDDYDAATAIGGIPFDALVDASGATVAADDPDMQCGDGVNQRTLWYRLTAPSDGMLTLDTVGSHDDTVVAIWQGSRGNLQARGCNDDGAYWSDTSRLNVTVQAGQTYTVELASRAPLEDGQVALRVDFNTCSYAGDEAAVNSLLTTYGLSGLDNYAEVLAFPSGTRCAVTGLNLANKQLSLPLPATIGDLRNLQTLDLQFNRIPDPLPASLGNLNNLRVLNLRHNALHGPLPTSLANLRNLHALELEANALSGPLPAQIRSMTRLQRLFLSSNDLSGPLPGWLADLPNLEHLWLGYNQLSGALPASVGALDRLTQLSLSSNELTGALPDELTNLRRLQALHLEHNQFSGPLPAALGDLTQLAGLYVEHNPLTGPLPASMTNLNHLWSGHFTDTSLCEPDDPVFQAWRAGVPD